MSSIKPQQFALMSHELDDLAVDLSQAREDKDRKKAVKAKLRSLLTSSSVNTVCGICGPLVAWIAKDSRSLLPVALNLQPDPDIISMSLHLAIRYPSTSSASVELLVDAEQTPISFLG
jgi:hypothetical protein